MNTELRSNGLESIITSESVNLELVKGNECNNGSGAFKSHKTSTDTKSKVPRTRPKRIKRCSISLYGNRPSYGIQTLHRDLWE